MVEISLGALSDEGVLLIGDGYRTKRSEYGVPGYRILRVADVEDWRIGPVGGDFVSAQFLEAIGAKLSQPGDVLLTTKGTIGRVAILPDSSAQVVYSPQLCFFRVKDSQKLNRRYLAYWFKSPFFVSQAEFRANSTDMAPYISLRDIRTLKLLLPSSRYQAAIAEVLGALDDKIAANDNASRLALELADAMFFAAQRNSPTRMTIGELAERTTLEYGDGYRTKRAEHGNPGLRILRAGDVRGFQAFADGDDFVSDDYVKQIGPKRSQPGDIVMTTKGTVGRVAVVPSTLEQVVYSPQLCYFRVKDEEELDSAYLAAWFRSADRKSQSELLMYKSDMAPYINLRDIRSLTVPIPDRSEMKEAGLVQRVLLDRFEVGCAENLALARTRDELLPLLMSGKVRVKDAEAAVSDLL
ncbi:restriction endonuclease subunit S [Antrihabitans sp. NCIMB 15449]|jgi:type I restriction enzyme, S subunit|uniref:Restriction endonuclease subunit S n=1 Tax=Antrihabitans spumae TaxID=3373370 RepID=A0ABW7JI59_9NOCA